MSFQTRAEEALSAGGDFNMKEFYPAPFPEDVATIELEKISLRKLLDGDEVEGARMFSTCKFSGFFYLDMLDHPTGRQIWRMACNLSRLTRDRMLTTSADEKRKYKPLPGIRVFDRGYLVRTADQEGQPDEIEIVNIPQSEFFGKKNEGSCLPGWLSREQKEYKEVLTFGNDIACTILTVLEKQLQLPTSSFTKLHQLTDESSDFVRILRYPGDACERKDGLGPFPAHRDAMSLAIVFAWIGGLQIADPNVKYESLDVKAEDWRWIRPEPGYAIVNLGDAMEIFTNKLLKSGIHRIVKAPGEQSYHDRMSVLLATRPENSTLMKAFESQVIPFHRQTEEIVTSLEWGHRIVADIQRRAQAQATTRATTILENA